MGGKQKTLLKPDVIVKDYWSGNAEFADLFNAVLFHGEQVIRPDELTGSDTDSSVVKEQSGGIPEAVRGARDGFKVHKRSTAHGVELVLLGLENQERVHYAMPMRVMGYDHSVYQKQYNENAKRFRASVKKSSTNRETFQIEKKEEISEDEFLSGMRRTDRFIPVVTIAVYYGEKPWDGAKSLHEMLDIPEPLRRYVNDYHMILIEARENRLCFHNKNNRDFFNLLEIILDTDMSKKDAKEKAIQYCEKNKADKDVVIAAAGATNTKLDYNVLAKKEGDTMCTLFEEIAKEGREEGREAERSRINSLILKLSELGQLDDITRAAADRAYQESLLQKYGL